MTGGTCEGFAIARVRFRGQVPVLVLSGAGRGAMHRLQMRTGSRGGSMTQGMRQWILEANTVFRGVKDL